MVQEGGGGRLKKTFTGCVVHERILFMLRSGGQFVPRSRTICAIKVDDVMRNFCMKLF